MEVWLEGVIRQLILYSLPVLMSLTLVSLSESKLARKDSPHPFHAVAWSGTWLPWMASIIFGRGMIISLPQPVQQSLERITITGAMIRFITHLLLCGVGFLLYSWSLEHQPATGLPPLHHWWSKVFMFFNLCMAGMHLVPLPGQLCGEIFLHSRWIPDSYRAPIAGHSPLMHTLIAATPLLDISVGAVVVFPLYEQLATLA